MGLKVVLALILSMVVCTFCGNDFRSVNRHIWRCQARMEEINPEPDGEMEEITNMARNEHICVCGKSCKGLRGLRGHQRSCRSIKHMKDELLVEDPMPNTMGNDARRSIMLDENPNVKAGIKLPKTVEDWELANTYFQSKLNSIDVSNTGTTYALDQLNSIAYEYFKKTYGLANGEDQVSREIKDTYKNLSKKDLKKELKKLKNQHPQVPETIRYVAKLLRGKLQNKETDVGSRKPLERDDNALLSNFYGFCKRLFVKSNETKPTFSKSTCENYFLKILSPMNPSKVFTIPSWIPALHAPTESFSNQPVTYKKICKVISRMKTSGSPCPLDQLSIICFKRCPYLRSYILKVCNEVIAKNSIPESWKKAVTILIYKKGDESLPENFRPITLEPITLKIFTSIIRDQIYEFLLKNHYIETHYQKGFTPGMSGTFEHIAEMEHVINQSRLKQRSLVITLIDLRNAFGTVNHHLIQTILKYHHIPDNIGNIIGSLYDSFYISILTNEFNTNFIQVTNGVLQGDCLSPLLFNMIINTFIQSLKQEKYKTFGARVLEGFAPRNWFQFADDAAAVTSLESENQMLVNLFSRWCNWADMLIRPDKCHIFGMKKSNTKSIQYSPKVYINNILVKSLKENESFLYLGRYFDFNMSDKEHQDELTSKLKEFMEKIDLLDIHPRNKLMIYQRYVLGKISWHLTVTNISTTWIKENLDNMVSNYVRSWLELPVSGTLKIATLSKSKYGLNFIKVSTRFAQCQCTFRKALKKSANSNIKKLHMETKKGSNIQTDSYLTTRDAIKEIRKKTETEIKEELSTQSLVVKSIWNQGCGHYCADWGKVLDSLPRNLYSFTIRYLSNSLANGTNAVKWGISNTTKCLFCNENQTLQHVVSSCKASLDEKRWNWRHDSILLNISRFMMKIPGVTVYCDIESSDFHTPSVITGNEKRPDIVIMKEKLCMILELTVGFETNMQKNTERKELHYKDLISRLRRTYQVRFVNLSMGAIGVIGKESNLRKIFMEMGLNKKETVYITRRIINVCIRSTYYLFCQRNKIWENPSLLAW